MNANDITEALRLVTAAVEALRLVTAAVADIAAGLVSLRSDDPEAAAKLDAHIAARRADRVNRDDAERIARKIAAGEASGAP